MYVITRITDNVIVAKSNICEKISNGYKLDSYILAETVGLVEFNVYSVESIPSDVKEQKYCYDGTEFKINNNYIEPYNEKEEIEQLKKENTEFRTMMETQNQAIAELTMMIATP